MSHSELFRRMGCKEHHEASERMHLSTGGAARPEVVASKMLGKDGKGVFRNAMDRKPKALRKGGSAREDHGFGGDVGRAFKSGIGAAGDKIKGFFASEGGSAEKSKMVMKPIKKMTLAEAGPLKAIKPATTAMIKTKRRGGRCKD